MELPTIGRASRAQTAQLSKERVEERLLADSDSNGLA